MNAKTLEAIKRHGESLLAAFPNATEKDPIALCKKLRRIENAVSIVTTAYCNGDATLEQCDAATERALVRVKSLLGEPHRWWSNCDIDIFFVNCDPRGHALKLDDKWVREYNHGKCTTEITKPHSTPTWEAMASLRLT